MQDQQHGERVGQLADKKPLTMGQYLFMLFVFSFPLLNSVWVLKWAFGRSGNVNRRNLTRAMLVIYALGVLIYVYIFILMTSFQGH